MAMKSCRECGTEISSRVKKCPRCGIDRPFDLGIQRWLNSLAKLCIWAGLILTVLGFMVAIASARAHVPPECALLFIDAGHANDRLVRRGQETSNLAKAGLDQRRSDDYLNLAEGVTRLLDAQTSFYEKLLAAIQCLEPNASSNILPMWKANGEICFPSEVCPEAWEGYEGAIGGLWESETGWYCRSRQRFCWTEGAGEACACSTKPPPQPGFVKL